MTEEIKVVKRLPSFKVKPDDKFDVWIAVDITSTPTLVSRLVLSKEEAQNTDKFMKIKATFAYWNWPLKSFLQNQSIDQNKDTGVKSLNAQKLAENKFRYLLLGWTVPEDDTAEPIPVKRDVIEGRPQLSDKTWKQLIQIHPTILEAFLVQFSRVVEYGEEPVKVNQMILEGTEEQTGLRSELIKFFKDRAFDQATVDACLKSLADGPLEKMLDLEPVVELDPPKSPVSS